MLRANLRYFNIGGPRRAVVVTSPLPGDGKSTVVWNLGIAAARAGQSVLIIEADLRRPVQQTHVDPDQQPAYGLVDVLTMTASIEESITTVNLTSGVAGSIVTIDMMVAGGIPPNPVDLVESAMMGTVIAKTSAMYDLVLIDTPPTSIVPDAIPILPHADGVIVVCKLERTTRATAERLCEHLRNLDAPVLGVVVNFARAARGYGYGYGQYGYSADAALISANGHGPQLADDHDLGDETIDDELRATEIRGR
jgi:receptor protein-tyrosine kinase